MKIGKQLAKASVGDRGGVPIYCLDQVINCELRILKKQLLSLLVPQFPGLPPSSYCGPHVT